MNFDRVLPLLKQGVKITHTDWLKTKEFLFLVDGSSFVVNRKPLLGIYPDGTKITYRHHIDRRYADGSIGVWSADQEMILSDGWDVVDWDVTEVL